MVAEELNIYEDLAEFIAGLSPQKVLAYHAPDKVQKRVEHLVAKKKDGSITQVEAQELEKFFVIEHIVRLSKARALKLVSTTAS